METVLHALERYERVLEGYAVLLCVLEVMENVRYVLEVSAELLCMPEVMRYVWRLCSCIPILPAEIAAELGWFLPQFVAVFSPPLDPCLFTALITPPTFDQLCKHILSSSHCLNFSPSHHFSSLLSRSLCSHSAPVTCPSLYQLRHFPHSTPFDPRYLLPVVST